MAHMRKQIRDAFKAVLDAALPSATYKVYSSRHYARNHTPGVAIVDMRFLNDQQQEIETLGDDRTRIASLYIRVQRSEEESALDDAMDADDVLITSAVMAADWSGLLEQEPEQLQTNFSDDAQSAAIGALVMRFDCEYRIDKSDPETRID